jgi:hypothetical protein
MAMQESVLRAPGIRGRKRLRFDRGEHPAFAAWRNSGTVGDRLFRLSYLSGLEVHLSRSIRFRGLWLIHSGRLLASFTPQ